MFEKWREVNYKINKLVHTKRGQLDGIDADMVAICDKINEIIDYLNYIANGVVCADGKTIMDCSE